jgi:hypothetical protein
MKKWHFTLKNGAFYPRIQSILAFFLGYFWWFYFVRICGRMRREYNYDLWELWKCEIVMWVCVSLPARALRTRGTSGTRPPTSCRAFLLRTLPPPPHPWIPKKTALVNSDESNIHLQLALFWYSVRRGCQCPSESSPALHEVGAAHPPPTPPPPPKAQK